MIGFGLKASLIKKRISGARPIANINGNGRLHLQRQNII